MGDSSMAQAPAPQIKSVRDLPDQPDSQYQVTATLNHDRTRMVLNLRRIVRRNHSDRLMASEHLAMDETLAAMVYDVLGKFLHGEPEVPNE